MAQKILYEDDSIIVVNKAANVETQGPRSLISLLDALLKSRRPPEKAYACHRLDKETSGVIVFAKDSRSQKIIMDQFRQGEVKKRYYAIIEGCPARARALIRDPIVEKIVRGVPVYKDAATEYAVIERHEGYCVADVAPFSGRKNQIRVHFKKIGHPLIGDRKFNRAHRMQFHFSRAALHAYRIEFFHPRDRRPVCFEAPLAEDMVRFLRTHH